MFFSCSNCRLPFDQFLARRTRVRANPGEVRGVAFSYFQYRSIVQHLPQSFSATSALVPLYFPGQLTPSMSQPSITKDTLIHQAYKDAATLFTDTKLSRWLRPAQDGKRVWQCRLSHLRFHKNPQEDLYGLRMGDNIEKLKTSRSQRRRESMPPIPESLRRVAHYLTVVALNRLQQLTQAVNSNGEQIFPGLMKHPELGPALSRLAERSVLRVWAYGANGACSPHCDPGLVTAMLLGCDGQYSPLCDDACNGLEVPLSTVSLGAARCVDTTNAAALVAAHAMVTPRSGHAIDVPKDVKWLGIHEALSKVSGRGDSVQHHPDGALLTNTTLHLLSGEQLPHCLHRVGKRATSNSSLSNESGRPSEEQAYWPPVRMNILVELRPFENRWYHLSNDIEGQ